ncbi:MAG: rhomboid family intramembrane serine protease [Sandaracinaceae bacterium]|nr:rhomboid family intramembrane serine protease [Sandaracinaceae bacterium]
MASLNQGGVAFFAHVGGFVAGLALVWLFRRTPNETHGWRGPPNVRVSRGNTV